MTTLYIKTVGIVNPSIYGVVCVDIEYIEGSQIPHLPS